MQIRNLIVIGASAGGIKAIGKIMENLPETMDAAIMIVLHMSIKSNPKTISEIFQKKTALECVVATDGAEIERGKIYLAPPDHHLMVSGSVMHLNRGAKENKHRPSINVLFRSAAVHFGNKTIGIVLTGMLDDGTSGMSAIKTCGGLCAIQDPLEAEYGDMPRNVLNKVAVDHIASLEEIPIIVEEILSKPLPPKIAVPEELRIEADLNEKMMSDIERLKKISERSDFACPECGGGLWKIKNDPTHRYRCHTGHVYSEQLLTELQDLKIEDSIWVSVRMLEEKQSMLRLLSARRNGNFADKAPYSYSKRIDENQEHINRLKSLLAKLSQDKTEKT